MSEPLKIGDRVTPARENVVARTAFSDVVFLHLGQVFEIIALGCDLAICAPESGDAFVSVLIVDLKGGACG